MNIISLFRLGMRVADAAAPHVEEWNRKRNLDRNEGQRHLKARNWAEAEVHLTAALAGGKHSSQQHWEMTLGLAAAQRGQGRLDEAGQTMRLAVELATAAGNHGWQMQALLELVDLELSREDYPAAQKAAEVILSKEGSRGNSGKRNMATASRKLGIALVKMGNEREALTMFDRAAKLAEESFGKDHEETARSLSELGSLQCSQGNHPEAQRCLKRAVEIHRAVSGDSHETTQTLLRLATSLADSGDIDAACAEFERVLTLKERQVGGNPEEKIEAQMNLARFYLQADRTSAARELLLQLVGIAERKGGPRLVTALELLAEAEQRAGRRAEAARWRQRLEMVGQPPRRPDIMSQFGRASA